jgi:ABC-2 type transport system permease protein
MKLMTIIKKEYLQIVKKKSFVISTILTPVLMAAFMFVPVLLTKMGREEKVIQIADYSGLVQQQFIEKSNQDTDMAQRLKLKFQVLEDRKEQLDKQHELLKDYETQLPTDTNASLQLLPRYRDKILDEKVSALLLIPENVRETRRIYFFSTNISDMGTNSYISSAAQKVLSERILTEKNIQLEIVREAIRDVSMGTFKVKKEGTSKGTSGMEYMMSIVMLTFLFSIIMGYGQLIMRGVIEEKNNRIVEVLISSTNASTLFYGKIIGIGLAGLTQVIMWIVLALMLVSQSSIPLDATIANFLTFELAIYFVIFFVVGYFMYSILFSIVGASVNTDQEAQQYSAPIIYLLMIPFIIGIVVTQSPNITLVSVASLFPLFTPTLMFMRISVAIPPFVQVLSGIVGSILFTMFLAWLGAKIFRVGILMYGKKPSLKEMLRWIRYK